ncbi:MAG: porin family protein [Mucilaginibacter sp.]|uniref:porin family protein n=1 Tax=Mucilaginibacter sp. TaxID=1882438 RepID=UPI00326756ED
MLQKLSFTLLAGFAFATHVLAQKFDVQKLHYNINAGFNISWFTNDVGVFNKSYPGYAGSSYSQFDHYFRGSALVNVSLDYPVSPKFGVAAGLAYSGRGGGYKTEVKGITIRDNDNNDVSANNNYNLKIDYMELPLLLQYNLRNPSSDKAFILYGGIAPAVRVGSAARYVYYPEDVTVTTVDETKVKQYGLNNANVFNLHPILGMQFGPNRDKNDFFIDLRFEYSLLPVFNNSSPYYNTQMWTGSFGFGWRGLFPGVR